MHGGTAERHVGAIYPLAEARRSSASNFRWNRRLPDRRAASIRGVRGLPQSGLVQFYESDERLAARAGEQVLEAVDELRERTRVEFDSSGSLDQIRQLLSELCYNIGHDLTYAHGEASSSLSVSAFSRVTCTQYEGASLPFTPWSKTTSERTYTRRIENGRLEVRAAEEEARGGALG